MIRHTKKTHHYSTTKAITVNSNWDAYWYYAEDFQIISKVVSQSRVVTSGSYAQIAFYSDAETVDATTFIDRILFHEENVPETLTNVTIPPNAKIFIVFNQKGYDGIVVEGCLKDSVDDIRELKEEVSDISTKIQKNEIPDYWRTFLDAKYPDIIDKTTRVALHGDSFLFYTDYHIEANAGNTQLLMQDIIKNTSISWVVCGGDVFNGSSTKSETFNKLDLWMSRFSGIRMFTVRGNHDYNTLDSALDAGAELTDSEMYNYYIRRNEDAIVQSTELFNYYFDNNTQKIRYICFDTKKNGDLVSDAQMTWLESVITELESDWTVIVFSHYVPAQIENGIITSHTSNGARLGNGLKAIQRSAQATIAAIITGHAHVDGYVPHDETGTILEIATLCDTLQSHGATMTRGTATEHAFDIFSIDTIERKIYTTRIGAGTDRVFFY